MRHYLQHFRDQHGSVVQLMAVQPPPKDQAWARLTTALGLVRTDALDVGAAVSTGKDAPRVSGKGVRVGEPAYPEELMLHRDEPAPGYAHLFAMPMAAQVFMPIRLCLFGERVAEVARRQEDEWQTWIRERLSQ